MKATRPPYACIQKPDSIDSMFKFPVGAKGTIRILPSDEAEEAGFRLQQIPIIQTEHGFGIDIEANCLGDKFIPHEFTVQDLALMNALRKKRQHVKVDVPKREKKSWMRYTSTKKWSRKFKSQPVIETAEVVTLQISKKMMQKLKALAKPLAP